MGLRTKLVRSLGGDVLAQVAEEAVRRYAEASGAIDPDESSWTKLTGSKRDLPSITHERAIEVCFSLYQQNPLAHRIVELMRDFTVGDGLMWDAINPDVEELVREFWDDPVNDLNQRAGDFALELSLFGELAPEVFTAPTSGIVQLGYIDASQIRAVECANGNPLVADIMRVRSKGAPVNGKPLQIVRARDGGRLLGEVFYFRVNGLSNSTRGWSDLLHIADWLDALDQLLWELLERARLVKSFVWDVTLEGADQVTLDAKTKQYPAAPRSGSVRYHNEKETWNAVAPSLGSVESVAEVDVLLRHISAGSGLPKHWLSATDDVNKAVAQTMDVPTLKRLSQRQSYFVGCMRRMVAFALDQAIASGRIAELVPVFKDGTKTDQMAAPIDTVSISAPEVSARDLVSVGQLLTSVTSALAVAEGQGWFGSDVSRQTLATVLSQLGVDFDPKDTPEQAASQDVPADVQEAIRAVGA